MLYAGAAFLIWYGARSLRSAFAATEALRPAPGSAAGLGTDAGDMPRADLAQPARLSRYASADRIDLDALPGQEPAFAAGAMTASVAFFFSLGYGAAILRPCSPSRSPGACSKRDRAHHVGDRGRVAAERA